LTPIGLSLIDFNVEFQQHDAVGKALSSLIREKLDVEDWSFFVWETKTHACSPTGQMWTWINVSDSPPFSEFLHEDESQNKELHLHYVERKNPFTLVLVHAPDKETGLVFGKLRTTLLYMMFSRYS
jgi:hypothetical protein